ncbi:MAG: cytochrome b/b6 domain-containing protein [Beijerinckiaceae bacterium]
MTIRTSAVTSVWDPWVRVFLWTLALSFVLVWFSAQGWKGPHDAAGYVAGALVLFRLVWGFVGGRFARFSQFARAPGLVLRYLKTIASETEVRFFGHNPAGGAMIVVLLLTMAATVVTGWLLTTDAFWGVTSALRAHSIVAHGVLVLVFLHLAGVVLASVRHRENLVRAMIFGDKPTPRADDVS